MLMPSYCSFYGVLFLFPAMILFLIKRSVFLLVLEVFKFCYLLIVSLWLSWKRQAVFQFSVWSK